MLTKLKAKTIYRRELRNIELAKAHLQNFKEEVYSVKNNLETYCELDDGEQEALDFASKLLIKKVNYKDKCINKIYIQLTDPDYIGVKVRRGLRRYIIRSTKSIFINYLIGTYLRRAMHLGKSYSIEYAKPLIKTDGTFDC